METVKKLSSLEKELYKILVLELKLENVITNYMLDDTLELDFYLPDYKYAIETNGLPYHIRRNGKGRNYHIRKFIYCKNKGIKLISLFSDDFKDKQRFKILIMEKLNLFKSISLDKIKNTKITLVSFKNQDDIKKYLKYNMNNKFKYMDYYIFSINNQVVSIIGIQIKEKICKILRFNNVYGNIYYKNTLPIFVNWIFNKFDYINQINMSVDNNFFSGDKLLEMGFILLNETGPRKQLADLYNKSRINLGTLQTSKKQKKYEIYDCGSQSYMLFRENFNFSQYAEGESIWFNL